MFKKDHKLKLVPNLKPMMLCCDCSKVYYHFDVRLQDGELGCDFCGGKNVCGCGSCISYALDGQLSLFDDLHGLCRLLGSRFLLDSGKPEKPE